MPFESQAPLRGNFVMLRADTLRLLLPQADVGTAGYLQDRPRSTARPGLLQVEGDERSFVALSSQMKLLPQCPGERFVYAELVGGAESMAWCWDELQVLINVEIQPQPVPIVLLAPHTPVTHYAEHAGEVAYLCSAGQLAGFALAEKV